jgi:hypothetical protein
MIWLAWRQFRVQALVAAVALAALAVILLVTGLDLRHIHDTSGVAACRAAGRSCGALESSFLSHDKLLQNLLGPLVLGVPALVGVFWGAPLLARELETGTYRLAWTQSISRWRWLAGKIAVVGLASIVVAQLVSLMASWWFEPIEAVSLNRFSPGVFSERGIVCIGYAAFAFAAGLAAGVVLRRTLPAMATALAAFIGARLAITYALRPNLASPAHITQQLSFGNNADLELGPSSTLLARQPTIPNAWVHSARVVDGAGHTPTRQALHAFLQQHCAAIALPGRFPARTSFEACEALLTSRFHLVVSYVPAGKYWTVQTYETAIFAALALVLIGGCFWWLRPRARTRQIRLSATAPRSDESDETADAAVISLNRPRSTVASIGRRPAQDATALDDRVK